MSPLSAVLALAAFISAAPVSTYFGEYSTGMRIEDPRIIPANTYFNISMTFSPTSSAYGILASYERAGSIPQMALEFYSSGRVGWRMSGTTGKDLPGGDPAGYLPDIHSSPLPLNTETHLSISRFVDGTCYMSINSVVVSTLVCPMSNLTNSDVHFRIGSRYSFDDGDDVFEPFAGEIKQAVYTVI
jgi:hypothetical protein